MGCESRVFKVDALWRVERMYRKRLTDEPGDMVARVSLAWCLFLQALHRAGEEDALVTPEGVMMPTSLEVGSESSPEEDPERAAGHLLEDCLRQAVTVLQLSPDPRDHVDVERLQALIRLSGGEAAIAESEEQSHRILFQLTREMMDDPSGHPSRFRRSDVRRRNSAP